MSNTFENEPVFIATVILEQEKTDLSERKNVSCAFMNILNFLIDPVSRKSYGVEVSSCEDFMKYINDKLGISEENLDLSGLDKETVEIFLNEFNVLCRKLFVLLCASNGYLADAFIDFNNSIDILGYKKVDACKELKILFHTLQYLQKKSFPYQNSILWEEILNIQKYIVFLEEQNSPKLDEIGIVSVLKDAHARIEFKLPVSTEEIITLVQNSCASDFGVVQFLINERIHLLLHRPFAEIIITNLRTVSSSSDLRRLKCFYKGSLQILSNLGDDDLEWLSQKYANNIDIYLPRWLYFISECEVLEGEPAQSHEAVIKKVFDCSSSSEMLSHLYLWSFIAPFVSTSSTECLFKRFARVLIHNFDTKQKKKFIQLFKSLSPTLRSIYFAENDANWETSLYSIPYYYTKEMIPDDIRKRGCAAIDLLLEVLSPWKMLNILLTLMETDVLLKSKIAVCIVHLMSHPKLFDEVNNISDFEIIFERNELLKRLFYLAVKNYEEPIGLKPAPSRFKFINSTITFLKKLFEENFLDGDKEMVKEIIQEKNFKWYQYAIMVHGFFRKIKCSLEPVQFDSKNIATFSDLVESQFSLPLTAWQGEVVKEAFSDFFEKHLSNVCPVIIACALLQQVHVSKTISPDLTEYIHNFVEKLCFLKEDFETECIEEILNETINTICDLELEDEQPTELVPEIPEELQFLKYLLDDSYPQRIRDIVISHARNNTTYKAYLKAPKKLIEELPILPFFDAVTDISSLPADAETPLSPKSSALSTHSMAFAPSAIHEEPVTAECFETRYFEQLGTNQEKTCEVDTNKENEHNLDVVDFQLNKPFSTNSPNYNMFTNSQQEQSIHKHDICIPLDRDERRKFSAMMIGAKGRNIQKLRNECNAKIVVTDSEFGVLVSFEHDEHPQLLQAGNVLKNEVASILKKIRSRDYKENDRKRNLKKKSSALE